MAQVALRAEPSLMHIFLFMASGAFYWSVFEPHGLVTLLTVDQFVLAAQGESSLVVVEGGSLPGGFSVACFALVAFLPVMLIILFVTGKAVGRRLV